MAGQLGNIISVGIPNRTDDSTHYWMSKLCLADAKHDFQEKLNTNKIKEIVDSYLPKEGDNTISISEGLDADSLFKELATIEFNDIAKNTLAPLGAKTYTLYKRPYKVYTKKVVDMTSATVLRDFIKEVTNKDDHAFVQDFSNYHLGEIAQNREPKYNTTSEPLTNDDKLPNKLYIIKNREVNIDPASKKNYMDQESLGFDIIPVIEVDTDIIRYSSFDQQVVDVKNDFFSSLTIEIGRNKNSYLSSIRDTKTGNTHNINYVISGRADNNPTSINNVVSALQTVAKIKDYRNRIPVIMKRSGDWLQALSSIQTERQYSIDLTNIPQILVTHDRFLLTYALSVGCHVLFCKAGNIAENNSFMMFYNTLNSLGEQVVQIKQTKLQRLRGEVSQIKRSGLLEKAMDLARTMKEYVDSRRSGSYARLTRNLDRLNSKTYNEGLTKYSEYARDSFKIIFDDIITEQITSSFIDKFNKLNNKIDTIENSNVIKILQTAYDLVDDYSQFSVLKETNSGKLLNRILTGKINETYKRYSLDKISVTHDLDFDKHATLILYLLDYRQEWVMELLAKIGQLDKKRDITYFYSRIQNIVYKYLTPSNEEPQEGSGRMSGGNDEDMLAEETLFLTTLDKLKNEQIDADLYYENNYLIQDSEGELYSMARLLDTEQHAHTMFLNTYGIGLRLVKVLYSRLSPEKRLLHFKSFYTVVYRHIILQLIEKERLDDVNSIFNYSITKDNIAELMSTTPELKNEIIIKIPDNFHSEFISGMTALQYIPEPPNIARTPRNAIEALRPNINRVLNFNSFINTGDDSDELDEYKTEIDLPIIDITSSPLPDNIYKLSPKENTFESMSKFRDTLDKSSESTRSLDFLDDTPGTPQKYEDSPNRLITRDPLNNSPDKNNTEIINNPKNINKKAFQPINFFGTGSKRMNTNHKTIRLRNNTRKTRSYSKYIKTKKHSRAISHKK